MAAPSSEHLRRRLVLASIAALGLSAATRRDSAPAAAIAANVAIDPERVWAARRASLCSSNNAVGAGLRGDYFATGDCRGRPLVSRNDPVIDFDADDDWPVVDASVRIRSVRWSGWIKAPFDGRYAFHVDVPGATATVANRTVVGAGVAGDQPMDLLAGRFYPITLRLSPWPTSHRRVCLEWTAPHGARYVVPRALLHLPTDSVRVAT